MLRVRERAKLVSFSDKTKFTRAQKFIELNKKKLEDAAVFFNPDTSFQKREEYLSADLRVLVVFGSPASVKAVSSTCAALNSYVKEICNASRTEEENRIPQVPRARKVPEPKARGPLNVFIDFTYVPNASDIKVFDKNNMPYAIGNITHLDASYFDVVGFSISVLSEVITCPSIIKSFSRCDYPIPLTWTERKSETLGIHPVIYAGGITAACSDIMFGDLGDGRQAFVDYLYLGSCEKMDIMWERHIEALNHNHKHCDNVKLNIEDEESGKYSADELKEIFDKRVADVGVYEHNGVSFLGPLSTQDFIDSLFDMPMIYQPQAYKVVFDNRNRVIENTKLNLFAQDFVKPYYPLKMDEDSLGIGMTIIQANGDNASTSQVQVSEGAMLKGTLIRTSKGLKRVEELAPREIGDEHVFEGPFVDTTGEVGVISHAFNHGVRKLRLFTLKSGIQIGLTDEHPVEQWRIGESKTSFKKAGELVEGDFFMLKKRSSVCGNSEMNESEAEFLGRMLGDGSYNLYDDSRGDRKSYHKMYLACDWEEVDYCEDLLERANILYTKDIEQGRHCRFWIKSEDKKGRRLDSDFWGFNQRYGEWENHTQGKKYIPAPAYQFDYIQMKAFLKGFHDADGCSSTNNGLSKVTFDSCHEHIINDVQQFLLFVGIPTTKHYYKKHRVADDELGFKETDNDHWCLNVSSEYFSEFNDLGVLKKAYCRNTNSKEKLPFDIETIRAIIYGREVSTEQRSRAFAAVRRNSFTKELAKKMGIDYPDFFYDEIISIEEVEGEVYDLTVPKLEKLIANGCSIHNCSAAGSCSFCAEGNYTGGWCEKSRDRILWEARESKKYSAGYKMKPFSFNILPIDTYVACGEGRFTQLRNLEKSRTVLTYKGEKSIIAGFLKDTKDRYFRFKLSRGLDARMSIKHKQMVLTEDGLVWKEADQLRVGDWIPQNIGYYSEYLKDYQFSEKDYFLGLWFGDGHRQQPEWKRSVQCFNVNEKELIGFCRNSDAFRIKSDKIREGVYDWIYEDEYTDYFKTIFPNYKYGENNLHLLNISQLLSFIKGWFDADGDSSLNKSNSGKTNVGSKFKVTFAEKSMNVARLVGAVLNSIGINFHLSPIVEVKLDGYDKVYKRRDLTITGLKSRQLFLKYIGFTQYDKLEKIRDSKTIWSDKDKTLPGLFGKYLYSELKKIGRTKGFNTSKFFNGIKGITESRFEEKFKGIDCEPVRLFEQGIRFSQIEKIEVVEDTIECADINEPKTNQFITEFGITHNCNYVTDYKGMLYEFMKIYPKVTFINMRMEELGRDVDALRMMKLVGSNRISAPMEGISPRIQNNLLNKCLSEESLTNFMDDMVHARLTDIKVGGIFTGYETDEDFQWICDFVDKYKQRAKIEGGNFPFRLKVTPLVHYNLTPIEYIERKSARKSFEGEHWLTDEWYEKFREHNVFFKVNGFRYSTFIEQSIIDLGRSATKWMYDNIIQKDIPVYSLRSFATEEIIGELKKLINKDWFFKARNPENYISISHRIHIDLMGSYIPRARRLVRLAEQGKILENEMDIRCLKTYDGAKTKCYSACVSKDPLKIYADVRLDENDNLIGEFRELKGCERCPDKEHKMMRLNRPTPQTRNSEDIIALPKLKPSLRLRFVIQRNKEYELLNPNNTSHTFVAKFLQKSERLTDIFYRVDSQSLFWQQDPDMVTDISGIQVVDVLFMHKDAYEIVKGLIDEVNSEMESLKIISCTKELVDDDIKVTDINIVRFETTLPYDLFKSSGISYKGEVRVKKDINFETIQDSQLVFPSYVSAGKVIGYFVCPMKYNPLYLFQGFLVAKKVNMSTIRETTDFEVKMALKYSNSVICRCGKEKGFVSLVNGKQVPFGPKCITKALLNLELKKK